MAGKGTRMLNAFSQAFGLATGKRRQKASPRWCLMNDDFQRAHSPMGPGCMGFFGF